MAKYEFLNFCRGSRFPSRRVKNSNVSRGLFGFDSIRLYLPNQFFSLDITVVSYFLELCC